MGVVRQGHRPRRDAVEVVAVVPVLDAKVVADRRPGLAGEHAVANERACGALVEVGAHVGGPEVGVLDDVLDTRRLAAQGAARPFGVDTACDAWPDAQALEDRSGREVLDVDPDARAVDDCILDPRALHGRPGPDPRDRATADAHALHRPGTAQPEAGPGSAVR